MTALLILVASLGVQDNRGAQVVDRSSLNDGFVQEMVTLYYFPSPLVLASTLNPAGRIVIPMDSQGPGDGLIGGGLGSTQSSAGDPPPRQQSLTGALGGHIDALNGLQRRIQAVEDAKLRLANAKDALVQAQKAKVRADQRVSSFRTKIATAHQDVEAAELEVTDATSEVARLDSTIATLTTQITSETDEEKRRLLESKKAEAESQRDTWRQRRTTRQRTLWAAQDVEEVLTAERKQSEVDQARAASDVADATAEQAAATTALSAAQSQLSQSQADIATSAQALRAARERAQLDASDRLGAFAREQLQAGYWTAAANPNDPDPVKRVEIFVYPNSSTLYIRGKPEDVRRTKEVIAGFDRPAPQARVTLWTLEVNLTGNKGRNALSSATTKIEEKLTTAREQMARVTLHFRSALNARVAEVQARMLQRNPVLTTALDGHRYARSFFFEPEVAIQLGLNLAEVASVPEYYYFTRWTLPDPAASTTLGEAVLIYILGTRSDRLAVLADFSSRLKADGQLKQLVNGGAAWTPEQFIEELGVGVDHRGSATLTNLQVEVLRALKRSALERFIARSHDIIALYSSFYEAFELIATNFIVGMPNDRYFDERPTYWESKLVTAVKTEISKRVVTQSDSSRILQDAGVAEMMAFVAPALLWLRQEFGINIQLLEELRLEFKERKDKPDLKSTTEQVRAAAQAKLSNDFAILTQDWLRRSFPTSESNARIAAADEMLKRIMISLEDDLQIAIVLPALESIKRGLQVPAVSVGTIGRTSLIATNRYSARVEGVASAELDLAGQERLIDASLSLANLISATKGSRLPDVLRRMQGFDEEPTSEFYAVASGSTFKVTPVFDPTGQALRFQFDHVKNTTVLDSDGTNPTLPRIDSHTTSMVVQLSNMEIRELTRYETNVKLGVPERRWGGIPFLNGIYPLSEIPIIGWFSRRAGRDAVSQTSIIYAQNAMYPTIGDLSNLLSTGFGIPPLAGTSEGSKAGARATPAP